MCTVFIALIKSYTHRTLVRGRFVLSVGGDKGLLLSSKIGYCVMIYIYSFLYIGTSHDKTLLKYIILFLLCRYFVIH